MNGLHTAFCIPLQVSICTGSKPFRRKTMKAQNKTPFMKQLHHQADYIPDPEVKELDSLLSFQVNQSCWAPVQKASLL